MPAYIVCVTETVTTSYTVNAPDEAAAIEAAERLAEERAEPDTYTTDRDAAVIGLATEAEAAGAH